MKCPICNEECNTVIIDTLDGRPVEMEDECADCSYRRNYAYGYTTVFVGDTAFSLNPRDAKEAADPKKVIETAIQTAKEMNKKE